MKGSEWVCRVDEILEGAWHGVCYTGLLVSRLRALKRSISVLSFVVWRAGMGEMGVIRRGDQLQTLGTIVWMRMNVHCIEGVRAIIPSCAEQAVIRLSTVICCCSIDSSDRLSCLWAALRCVLAAGLWCTPKHWLYA